MCRSGTASCREQKDDLETAQTDLRKVIEQLTVSMKEIFATEFAKLNVYFRDTFREIFGGRTCRTGSLPIPRIS